LLARRVPLLHHSREACPRESGERKSTAAAGYPWAMAGIVVPLVFIQIRHESKHGLHLHAPVVALAQDLGLLEQKVRFDRRRLLVASPGARRPAPPTRGPLLEDFAGIG
jgi:hypothetical protein